MSTPCNPPLEVIPYKIKNNRKINVIRDDYLEAGTKQRGQKFFDRLHSLIHQDSFSSPDSSSQSTLYQGVVTIAATSGYGQLATATMCRKSKLRAYIIVPYEVPVNYMTERVNNISIAKYIVVTRSNHQLRYIDPITNQRYELDDGYPDDDPNNTRLGNQLLDKVLTHFTSNHPQIYGLGLGLDDPNYISALVEALSIHSDTIHPKRMWLVVGSGTILRSFKKLWPNTEFLCVQVGRDIKKVKEELGIVTPDYISKYKFIQDVRTSELPPFPSLANYDAKAWSFITRFGQDGDYFWNVAGGK